MKVGAEEVGGGIGNSEREISLNLFELEYETDISPSTGDDGKD